VTTGGEGLIRNLEELRDAGILSEEEFETKRKEVMRHKGRYPPGGP
jgi:hypothetical protein